MMLAAVGLMTACGTDNDVDTSPENGTRQRRNFLLIELIIDLFFHHKMFTRCKITKKTAQKW